MSTVDARAPARRNGHPNAPALPTPEADLDLDLLGFLQGLTPAELGRPRDLRVAAELEAVLRRLRS